MSSLSLFGFSFLLLSFVSGQLYHDHSMDIQTLEGIQLPIHTYGGIGGIFQTTLYAHSGFHCTQHDSSWNTIPTIFLLDLEQTYLTTDHQLLHWNQNNIANWSRVDYDYTDTAIAMASGISTSSSSTQLGSYSYALHPGTNTMLKYDLIDHQYTDTSHFNHIISSTQLTDSCNLNDGNRYLYSIGGRDTTHKKSVHSAHVYRYDTWNDAWNPLTDLNAPRFAASCVMDRGMQNIYVLGGDNDDTKRNRCLSSIEAYDMESDVWTLLSANMIQERYQHISVLHPNHWIMSIGGIDGEDKAVGVELLDPSTQYTATTEISYDRTRFYYAIRSYPMADVLFLYGGMNDGEYYDDIQYIVLSTSDHVFPTHSPTTMPSVSPTLAPTMGPTSTPTSNPTIAPSISPTMDPKSIATSQPTIVRSISPTITPTIHSTSTPTSQPSIVPSLIPTLSPFHPQIASNIPTTLVPTNRLSVTPSYAPTVIPSKSPSAVVRMTESPSTIATVMIAQYTNDTDHDLISTSADGSSSHASSPDSLDIESLWTLLTSNITHAIISALVLIICFCGCCLCYFMHRSRKAHSQLSQKVDGVVKALKIQKPPPHIQFPHTIPSKSSTGTGTYKRDSGLYDIDGYLNGALASSPSSYLSSPHNRSYNSNAMTRPSPSATAANRQIGYRTMNHIAIPIGVDNLTDDDGEYSTNKLSFCNSNSMSDSDHRMDTTNAHRKQRRDRDRDRERGRERSHTEWKQKQQQKQMMSYRNNQFQWQFQRPRAVSYGQYHYQPYYRNYNGYYMQNNNRNVGAVPPPPPVRLPPPQEAYAVPGLVNMAVAPRLLNVPPPPPSGSSDITHITASSMPYDHDMKEEDDEGDSVSSDLGDTSSSAHSHTYADREPEEDAEDETNVEEDEEILSDISPMNSKYIGYSSNSLMEQKADLDEEEVTIKIEPMNNKPMSNEPISNKPIKRRTRQMIVFKPQTEILKFEDPSMELESQNYRFEPGASKESIENAHAKNLTELVYDGRMNSVYESENDGGNSDVDESNSFIRKSPSFDDV